MADEDNPIENIDKHYMRQKKIATILVAFQDILSEFAETADFVEDLKEWSFEYKRIHHWLGGWGMQGWTEKYIIPKILEEQGHSEDELQKIMSPLGYVQDIQKFVRDDIMNGKDYKRTWQGLI
jgi:DNA-binding ferritin-like protein (Dps family)